MGNEIETYLVELERILRGRVSRPNLEELMMEVRSHLEAAKSQSVNALPVTDSEILAVQNFGSPRLLAMRYLREYRIARSRTGQWIALGIAVLLFVLPALGMFAHEYFWQIGGERTWFTLLVLFFAAVVYIGRSLVLPLVTTMVGAATILALFATPQLVSVPFWGPGQGEALYSRNDLEFMKTKYEEDRKEKRAVIEKLERGAASFVNAVEAKDIPAEFRSDGEFLVPAPYALSYHVGIKWRKLYYLHDAKLVWRRAQAIAAQIQSKQHDDERRLNEIAIAQMSNPWSHFGRVTLMSFAWAEICVALLLFLNFVGCALHELGLRVVLRRRIA